MVHQPPPNSWPALWACYFPDTLPALLLMGCLLPRSAWPSKTLVATQGCNSNTLLSDANKNVHTVLPFDLWLQQPWTEPSDLSVALTPFRTSMLTIVTPEEQLRYFHWRLLWSASCFCSRFGSNGDSGKTHHPPPHGSLQRWATKETADSWGFWSVTQPNSTYSHSLCNSLSTVNTFFCNPLPRSSAGGDGAVSSLGSLFRGTQVFVSWFHACSSHLHQFPEVCSSEVCFVDVFLIGDGKLSLAVKGQNWGQFSSITLHGFCPHLKPMSLQDGLHPP